MGIEWYVHTFSTIELRWSEYPKKKEVEILLQQQLSTTY